jgi:tetratricopeptide (TPR) repeat protein
MKPLRAVLALLLVAAVILVIARQMVPRLQCNAVKGKINRQVRSFGRMGDENERTAMARANVATVQECLEMFPEDYQLHMLRAANLRVLGSYDEAVRTFQYALTITERPEIYAQIGELEIERGNIDAARESLIRAAMLNVMYVEVVDQPLRGEIYDAVMARAKRLKAGKATRR